jgi:hypothetical protein
MATDTFGSEVGSAMHTAAFDLRAGCHRVLSYFGYSVMIIMYAGIFALAVLTLGLIEIRQSNLAAFNGLIAKLDEKDTYDHNYFTRAEEGIDSAMMAYQGWKGTLSCAGQPLSANAADKVAPAPTITFAPSDGVVGGGAQDGPDKTCAIAGDHLNKLSLLKEDLLFRHANLPVWYDSYRDGIRTQSPQLIPILGLVGSRWKLVTIWARMPFELLEMLLLICMGALGGVIGVTRVLVDTATPNPSARDLCYRPAAGAVIALGIYVLFRATQLFFGGGQNDSVVASTSVFLLAALGLASGFCAREAVDQIEFAATRILRRSAKSDGDDDKPPMDRGEAGGTASGGAVGPVPVAG